MARKDTNRAKCRALIPNRNNESRIASARHLPGTLRGSSCFIHVPFRLPEFFYLIMYLHHFRRLSAAAFPSDFLHIVCQYNQQVGVSFGSENQAFAAIAMMSRSDPDVLSLFLYPLRNTYGT
ncbi:MAG: hypothetical protein ACSHXI_18855 [Hoeflea sp.]|uniref:hypothetical protein n=1 Tax=Hoeflea sp. TaxID=1940281 RepID=UPI003EF189D0